MGAPDESKRVEVDLVSVGREDPESPFARPRDSAPVATGHGPPDRDERRTVAIAIVVGLVALGLGWMLGRSAADAPSLPELDVAETAAAVVTEEPIASVDAVSTPTTTLEAAASTSAPAADNPTAAAIVVEQVVIADAIAGQPLEVVVYGNGNRLLRLDLTNGQLTSQMVDRQPFGRPRLVVADDWAMLPTADPASPTILVQSDGDITTIDFSPNWLVLGPADGETVWLLAPDLLAGNPGSVKRVTELGTPVSGIELPGPPSRIDPRGGFIVEASGGAYSVTEQATIRITPGKLIAVGPALAVAEECDELLVCTVVVIDRDTDERGRIEQAPDGSRPPSLGAIGSRSVSPDGTIAMVWVMDPTDRSSGQPTIGTLDLATGEVVEVGPAQSIDQAVWTPDSRFLLYISGGKLVAYDRESRDEVIVSAELIAIDAFGVRPITDRS